ncbi:MAG: ATP-binding protein [Burkholderiales bacterium]|jgi:signal transduction histidine kinase/ActR/RegA family two-component response regulator|nr:ATP-binding protein [Burkholderiales bacterium]
MSASSASAAPVAPALASPAAALSADVRADIERRVDADLLRTLWQQDPTGIATNYLAAALAAWVHWDRFDHGALLAWAGAWWVSNTVYLGIHLVWRRRDAAGRVPRRPWFGLHAFCDAISALPVGLCAWFFSGVPDALWLNTALIITYVAGIFAATLMSPLSYLSAAGWCLAPLLATHLREGTRASYAVAIALTMLYAFLALYSFVQARQIRAAVRSGYENEALARRLADETAQADAARATAEQAREVAEAARRDAEAAGRAKARFLAAATHDLRQPLHALALTLETLRLRGVAPDASVHVARAQDSARDLATLFDALLDQARLDAGTVVPQPTTAALAPLLRALEARYSLQAEARGLWLRARVRDVVVHTDPLALQRILSNLIVNALQATDHGGVLIAWRGGARAIEVRDSGRGIAPDLHDAVFDEFFRGPPGPDPAARTSGLGLGLATVRRLGRLLGHDITLRSRPGRGSVFAVRFAADQVRRAEADPGPWIAPTAPLPTPQPAAVLAGRRVLAVDDDAAIRVSLAALLEGWGIDVRVAADAAEADAACTADWRPDVLIVDRHLGRDDGPTLAASLRARCAGTPGVLIVTGDTAPDALQALAVSGFPVLHKPVAPDVLHAALCAASGFAGSQLSRPSATSSSARERTP